MIMLFTFIIEALEALEATLHLGDVLVPLFGWSPHTRLRLETVSARTAPKGPHPAPLKAALHGPLHAEMHDGAGQGSPASFGVGIKSLLDDKKPAGDPAADPLAYPAPVYPVSAVEAGRVEPQELAPLQETVAWMRHFLAKPHPELGRSGPVCPFVPISMTIDTIYLCMPRLSAERRVEEIEQVVNRFRDVFLELHPQHGDEAINKSLLMVFPQVQLADARRLIDEVQQRLKPLFTRYGLMLGEFHNLNDTPGLRNPAFRPLRSPLCMLVIRHMVESDLPFLERSDDPPGARVGFLRSYLRRLGGKVSERKLDMAIDALIDAEIELRDNRAPLPASAVAEKAAAMPPAEALEAESAAPAEAPLAAAGKCPFGHS